MLIVYIKNKKEVRIMSYEKPQVLAESKKNVPYSMGCMTKSGYSIACKP